MHPYIANDGSAEVPRLFPQLPPSLLVSIKDEKKKKSLPTC